MVGNPENLKVQSGKNNEKEYIHRRPLHECSQGRPIRKLAFIASQEVHQARIVSPRSSFYDGRFLDHRRPEPWP